LAWIIDDGFKKRPHRNIIVQENIKELGIVAGPHHTA
jgi:hypothetical protein